MRLAVTEAVLWRTPASQSGVKLIQKHISGGQQSRTWIMEKDFVFSFFIMFWSKSMMSRNTLMRTTTLLSYIPNLRRKLRSGICSSVDTNVPHPKAGTVGWLRDGTGALRIGKMLVMWNCYECVESFQSNSHRLRSVHFCSELHKKLKSSTKQIIHPPKKWKN